MMSACSPVLFTLLLTTASKHLIMVSAQAATTPEGGDDESKLYPVEEEKLAVAIETTCHNVPKVGEFNRSWSDTLTSDELYELAFLSYGYGLSADAVAHMPIQLGWRRALMDQLQYIARLTCNTPAISSSFIATAKNLFLYYMGKYENTLMASDDNDTQAAWKAEAHLGKWANILEKLSKCAMEIAPIHFQDDCGAIESFQDNKGGIEPINVIYEQFDEEFEIPGAASGLDLIVDSVWWMFATTYARCYSHFYPNEDIILQFLQRFREDVIKFFFDRWRGAGELDKHFELVFGPIEALVEHENLRKCANAAFDHGGLSGRHLIRPVIVTVNNRPVRNYKLELPTAIPGKGNE